MSFSEVGAFKVYVTVCLPEGLVIRLGHRQYDFVVYPNSSWCARSRMCTGAMTMTMTMSTPMSIAMLTSACIMAALSAVATAVDGPYSNADHGVDQTGHAGNHVYTPVAWYRFEDPADVGKDYSGNGRHLHLAPQNVSNCRLAFPEPVNATTFPRDSICGGWLSFNGNARNQTRYPQRVSATCPATWDAIAPLLRGNASLQLPTPENTPTPESQGGDSGNPSVEDHSGGPRQNGAPSSPPPPPPWPGVTIEFLYRPAAGLFLRGGLANLFATETPALSFKLTTSEMEWTACTVPAVGGGSAAPMCDVLSVPFKGTGVLAADSLWSKNSAKGSNGWHHVALVKDGASGNQSIWIDGVSTGEMQQPGNATNRRFPVADIYIDDRNSVALSCYLDEVAIYDTALPGELIYRHYNDSVTRHTPYAPWTAPGAPVMPPAPQYPTPDDGFKFFNAQEYPLGTILPSPAGKNNTNGVGLQCRDQLLDVPSPRFNATSVQQFGTPYNFNWLVVCTSVCVCVCVCVQHGSAWFHYTICTFPPSPFPLSPHHHHHTHPRHTPHATPTHTHTHTHFFVDTRPPGLMKVTFPESWGRQKKCR